MSKNKDKNANNFNDNSQPTSMMASTWEEECLALRLLKAVAVALRDSGVVVVGLALTSVEVVVVDPTATVMVALVALTSAGVAVVDLVLTSVVAALVALTSVEVVVVGPCDLQIGDNGSENSSGSGQKQKKRGGGWVPPREI